MGVLAAAGRLGVINLQIEITVHNVEANHVALPHARGEAGEGPVFDSAVGQLNTGELALEAVDGDVAGGKVGGGHGRKVARNGLGRVSGWLMRRSALFSALAIFFMLAAPAQAHRSGCHRWHSCPSDTGSYVCGDLGYTSGCGTESTQVPAVPNPVVATLPVRHTTAPLNLRQAPSTTAPILARTSKDAALDVVGCTPTWCQVKVRGYEGYVSRAYLR